MRVAVTGTPGTGKTSALERVVTDLDVLHLNDVIGEEGLHDGIDEERNSYVTDLAAVERWLGDRDDLVIDSHLGHLLDVDRVVVLRCRPDRLERRLRERGESAEKARENAESEALDLILSEAVERHGLESVYEIDTTGRSPEAVAGEISRVVEGEREPTAGEVSFVEYI